MKMNQMKKMLAKSYSKLSNCIVCGLMINAVQYDQLGIQYKANKCTDCVDK